MINFVKGIVVGIFNIIPGLSGSMLLIIFDLYDKCIFAISNIFKKPKESIIFLIPIGIGIALGTFLFSKVIFFFLNNYETTTLMIFIGFIFGTIPHLIKEAIKKGFNERYIVPFLITLSIGISLVFICEKDFSYYLDYNIFSILKYFSIGIILSISTIIPGISSTILLSIFSLYGVYIYSISSINLIVLIPTFIGFIFTTFIISKLINYLINNYYGYTYFAILGFSISTIPALISFDVCFSFSFILSIILGIISFYLTYKFFDLVK